MSWLAAQYDQVRCCLLVTVGMHGAGCPHVVGGNGIDVDAFAVGVEGTDAFCKMHDTGVACM